MSDEELFSDFVRRQDAVDRREGDEAAAFHAFVRLSRYLKYKPAADVIERIHQHYAADSPQN
jgi:hypothetical protein